ncbi:excinuclease ABC subunit UvrA [Xanthomonas vasicola]|uniref:excinuclease ABC subunit UvrA n=1 Tax=Xanthomonas vasicola TaxID=56459 RepID=UPI0002E153C5|nr:excinuclease ABC subunit UvrA [Xanthomonas vasicola]AZR30163.1 excinuclease ABC subunit UvrA [Xanthomonas vasicola pv. musacearum NCPPB 4379]KFA05756.1 excinuclease ABC subunit A [Xanthomonas vasicola pv. musacearum NCPPB 2005]KFA11092.1 excinuclease ABC subunit A [Xanthomonas vasicola pv. musacearum NCPPB 4380]KFA21731.1 excinuclease ABC subunit A [Xanthomonas vasicola pv. musacearum NCPPB 4392]KFA25047.1 excinuclease ABC subunit A [Xanthomonas vasicola pv. musacearum NCPPB 4394]
MSKATSSSTGLVRVRGAREHNLKNVDVDIPRDALVVFTGVSGSGKSSLAFGTIFAEAQRRYLDSISPYARRLIDQVGVPEVDSIDGLPPAVALQQARGAPSARSSVGSVTTISNSLRMLYSRAGQYPPGQGIIYADGFSPNTPAGACPTCHGLGRIYDATEATMVLDSSLSIRDRAVAAWPGAWHGQNQRDILTTLGHDVDVPWHTLPKKTRDWILFTDEQPVVPVYAGYSLAEVKRALKRKEEPSYMGTFTSARRYVLHTFATTQSAQMKKRVAQYLLSTQCPHCDGKRLRREALSVTFAGLDIGELSRRPLDEVAELLRPAADAKPPKGTRESATEHPEQVIAAQRIAADLRARIAVVQALGLGYLSLERSTPTLSPGELQRLRLATQIRSQLFGVVYVMDEPSAGLHPADAQALLGALDQLKAAGNSVFVVEHEVDVIRHADWIVDVGPAAGVHGGQVLYSGPPAGLEQVQASSTRRYLFGTPPRVHSHARPASGWLQLRAITRNNVRALDMDLPLGVFTTVTGVSGSGKSSLVSQALVELLAAHLGQAQAEEDEALDPLERGTQVPLGGAIVAGLDQVRRLVRVDQKPIGRTPRSNLATYTGLFDPVRKLFAATPAARRRRYDPGQFSFNVAKGRCATCEGEGSVYVELLFMPSVYAPCPTCHGARYNAKTLEIELRGKNIAQVLEMTVEQAAAFFADDASVLRPLQVLREVGLGYLRLGQPATELSGGEAQRIKLATELQRAQRRDTVYVLDEPTTGLHPADVDTLMTQLQGLVDAGNTVIVVEHDMRVAASSDWVLDMGPGAGGAGGRVVVSGAPAQVAQHGKSRTAAFLAALVV